MTKKERILAAINFKSPDYTPSNIELCSQTMQEFCKSYGVAKDEFFDFANNHIEKISFNGGGYIRPDFFCDEFGVVWNRTGGDDIGVVDKYLLADGDISLLNLPKIDKDDIKLRIQKVLTNGRDTFKCGKIGMLLFERAWSLRSMEELLMDFYGDEDFANALFAKITDYNIEVITEALNYPLDGFYFGDDYGTQTGLIMGPVLWRKFIKPFLAKIFEPIKKKGLPIILHSCGNILDILDDLVEIGLDCYQTVQPEIYDLEQLKKRYDKKLCFYGAISTQQFLPYAKPQEIENKIKSTINILGKNGGYICAPTHQVPDDVPSENIMAMIAALKRQ